MSVVQFGVGLAVVVFIWIQLSKPKNSSLPPGPNPLPVVGNVANLTAHQLWLRATQWAKEYGNVVYLHVFGQGLVFLNSYEAAVDLLEKQGSVYSDKPGLVMCGELCGCENMVAFTRYGDKSRRQRRLMQQALGVSAVRTYQPLLEIETAALLKRLLADPQDYVGNVRRYAGGLTLLVMYGYRANSKDDQFLMLADTCVDLLSNHIASGGGIWLVDIFPFLKHLPLWFPGAGFKRKAIEWKAKMEEFVNRPYELLKQRMREGTAVPCFCSTLLEELQDRNDKAVDAQKDFDIRWTANSMYSASIDTTITMVMHFIRAMVLHPEVLVKVQQEMDTVVGQGRLPTFSDRVSLPYLECVMSECLRWGAPVPLGLPHRLTEDDVYQGMHIPKGSLVFANIWNMMRNEELYPDAQAFKPERFMEEADEQTAKRRDPRNFVFGFGRRRCPGMHLMESSFWIVMASMIATMDLAKAVDEHGNVVEPETSFDNAVFRIPTTFKCDIRPRSEQALRIVRQAADAA
ncbi:Multifunctional cytochrome P450 monooxygenase af510 [Sparassis crispa]|uniref:Multifunctional cytochrome P450 monooxygenase af510 n=1 Tax=Sparassis crispa TaxID=139825 RepID=A0A401GQ54_9APHY|nr:Multifunctional cytochrome P450 monooxygenase af510 [Sparassis crispa]GBE84279.1 Multifunctional cytochrome P450 monooxygenase af510 [Sparassis crispa]